MQWYITYYIIYIILFGWSLRLYFKLKLVLTAAGKESEKIFRAETTKNSIATQRSEIVWTKKIVLEDHLLK